LVVDLTDLLSTNYDKKGKIHTIAAPAR
jgi:hypothetical protein